MSNRKLSPPLFPTFLFATILTFISILSQAQFVFERNINIPVYENNKLLKFPWQGGFNCPQFSDADLNNDGIMDLVVFDRGGDKFSTFINHGTPNKVDYTYAPQYADKFPELHFWVLMDDFNCDGITDIFTSTPGRIEYYQGWYDADNFLRFDSITYLVYDTNFDTFPPINIFVSAIDLPAFIDVNNDGDIDVLTFTLSGGVMEYYENLSQEFTGTCADSTIFELRSSCWGDFYEPNTSNKVIVDDCGGWDRDSCIFALKTSGKSSRGPGHSGSTVLAYDEDGDGDKEVILGDISFYILNRLINGGTPYCADIIAQDHTFPSYDVPYNSPLFPASFYVDVNNDGLSDLLASPNDALNGENYYCSWFYKNVGTIDTDKFQLQTDTFLVNDALDFGSGAYPVFFDYNGDRLMDILVGNYGYYSNGVLYKSGLALLKNIGDSVTPVFDLVNKDYAGFSSIFSQRRAIYPALGDMDADGDLDMIVGDNEGYLHYFENTGGAVANFILKTPNYFGIDYNSFAAPFIYDVNGDSLPDLIVGNENGVMNYYENKGTDTAAVFSDSLTTEIFGNINVRIPGFPYGNATPIISKLDTSKKIYLLSGEFYGKIMVYEFNADSIYGGTFRKKFNQYSGIDVGDHSSLSLADLNMDGKFEMVVGNFRGGLSFYTQSNNIAHPLSVQNVPENLMKVSAYPNPAGEFINIQIENLNNAQNLTAAMFDVIGKSVLKKDLGSAQGTFKTKLNIASLSSGIYFLRIETTTTNRTIKILIKN